MKRTIIHKLAPLGITLAIIAVLFGPLTAPVAHAASCSLTNIDFQICIGEFAITVMSGVGHLAGWAGNLLDAVVKNLVLEMKDFVDKIGALDEVWRTLRDFTNIFFIFILIYASIATILDVNGFQTKQVLARLVVVALLVNFSLFLTNVVIDASNILALQFHDAIQYSDSSSSDPQIAQAFMSALKVTTTIDETVIEEVDRTGGNIGFNLIIVGVMGIILFLVLIFVFIAAALLLLMRFALLLIVMILSPVAFMAMILPKTQQYWEMWWKTLLDQALFAPAFFLMLYITMSIMTSDAFESTLNPLGYSIAQGATEPSIQSAGIFISFLIIIGLLIASIIIAKKLGGQAGSIGYSWAQRGQKWVQNKVKKGSLAATRGTVGQTARVADTFLANTRFGNTAVGSSLRKVTTGKLANKKFGGKSAVDTYGASQKDKRERLAQKAKIDLREVSRFEQRDQQKVEKLNERKEIRERAARYTFDKHHGEELTSLKAQETNLEQTIAEKSRQARERVRTNNPLLETIQQDEQELARAQAQARAATDPVARGDAERLVERLEERLRATRGQLQTEENQAIREAAAEEMNQYNEITMQVSMLEAQKENMQFDAVGDKLRTQIQSIQKDLNNQTYAKRVQEKWRGKAQGWRKGVNEALNVKANFGENRLFSQNQLEDIAANIQKTIEKRSAVGEEFNLKGLEKEPSISDQLKAALKEANEEKET